MERASCHLFGALKFAVPQKCLEYLCIPVSSHSQDLAEDGVYLNSFPLRKHCVISRQCGLLYNRL
jgi:hypothetical protein